MRRFCDLMAVRPPKTIGVAQAISLAEKCGQSQNECPCAAHKCLRANIINYRDDTRVGENENDIRTNTIITMPGKCEKTKYVKLPKASLKYWMNKTVLLEPVTKKKFMWSEVQKTNNRSTPRNYPCYIN